MEEFLPGLLRMMEERFGRFGRPIGTALLILIAGGIAGWAIHFISQYLVGPIYGSATRFQPADFGWSFSWGAIRKFFAYALVWGGLIGGMGYLVQASAKWLPG